MTNSGASQLTKLNPLGFVITWFGGCVLLGFAPEQRRTLPHLRQLLILLSCLLLSTACACAELPIRTASPATAVAATPLASFVRPLQVTPESITAQLRTTSNLEAAAEQMADLLQIPLEQIQVRIRSKDCTVCNLAEQGADNRPPLLSVTEAAAQLQAYDLFWLSVQTLTCTYYFDGDTITPRNCQLE